MLRSEAHFYVKIFGVSLCSLIYLVFFIFSLLFTLFYLLFYSIRRWLKIGEKRAAEKMKDGIFGVGRNGTITF